MIKWMVLVAAALLAGCQTQQPSEMSYTEVKAFIAEMQKRCEAQGISAKSPELRPCVQQEINRESSIRFKNRQAQLAISEGLSDMGTQMQAANNRQVNCTSTRYGNTVRTNCY